MGTIALLVASESLSQYAYSADDDFVEIRRGNRQGEAIKLGSALGGIMWRIRIIPWQLVVLAAGALSGVACSSQSEPGDVEKPPATVGYSVAVESTPAFDHVVVSAWGNSSDGAISVRIQAPAAVRHRQDAIEVLAVLRNNGKAPLIVKKPLADPAGFDVVGPLASYLDLDQAVPMIAGRSPIAVVEPGESIADHLRIPLKKYRGGDVVGRNRLRFIYRATAADRSASERLGKPNHWTGEVSTGFIVVTLGSTETPTQFESSLVVRQRENDR